MQYDASKQYEIKRQRKMAEMLQQLGKPIETQVVGGIAVPQSPWISLAKGLASGAGNYQAAQADTMEQEQAKRQQELYAKALGAKTREEAGALIGQDPSMLAEALKFKFPDSADLPSAVEEYNFYKNLPPSEQPEFLKVKRTNPYLDVGGQLVQPNPATGGVLNSFDKTTTPKDEEKERQTKIQEQQRALAAINENAQTAAKIQEVLNNPRGIAGITGFSSMIPNRPGSESANAQADIDTIKARSAFGGLQEMRMNSPTGGALGGIAVQELEMLKNAEASLQNAQSEEEFKKSLTDYKMALQNADNAIKNAFKNRYGEELPMPAAPSGGNASPVDLPEGAKQAPDGNYYVPDPNRPGKYQRVN